MIEVEKVDVEVTTFGDEEEDTYTCEEEVCEKCGLRFVCYTEREKTELDWKSFCAVLKGKNRPLLIYKG